MICSHPGEEASERILLSVDHMCSHAHSKKLQLKPWPVEFKPRPLASISNVGFLDKHSCAHTSLQHWAAVQISPFIFLYLADATLAVLVLKLVQSSWLGSSGACKLCRTSVCPFSSYLCYCPLLLWLLTQVLFVYMEICVSLEKERKPMNL